MSWNYILKYIMNKAWQPAISTPTSTSSRLEYDGDPLIPFYMKIRELISPNFNKASKQQQKISAITQNILLLHPQYKEHPSTPNPQSFSPTRPSPQTQNYFFQIMGQPPLHHFQTNPHFIQVLFSFPFNYMQQDRHLHNYERKSTTNRYSGSKLQKHIALSASRHHEQDSYLEKLRERYTNRAYRSIENESRLSSSHRMSPTLDLARKPRLSKGAEQTQKSPRNDLLKLPEIMKRHKTPVKNIIQKSESKHKQSSLVHLQQIEDRYSNSRRRPSPLKLLHQHQLPISVRTKAGTTGKNIKINQDIEIIDQKLPHGVKLFCICDGHGVNGHHVTAFIKKRLLQNLKSHLKQLPQIEYLQDQIYLAFQKTNQELLASEINTELSGSTVVAVFLHNNKIYCFNVGDSRAILINHQYGQWKPQPLSKDQKPCREDQARRIITAGGRIDNQVNEKGQKVGPLRVWMKDVRSPGLAMTRSFGDKAGIKAGTNAQPQILEHYINQSNKYILVASDGIWEHLQNHEVIKAIAPQLGEGNMQDAANTLLENAIDLWESLFFSRDDITFVLVKLPSENCD